MQFVVHAMLHTPFPQDLIRLEAFSRLMANVLRGLEGAQETHLVQNKMGERFHVTTIADSKGLSQFSKMWAELQVEHRNAVALGRKLSDPTAPRPEVGSRHVNRDLVDNYMSLFDSTSSNSTGVSWFRDTVIQSAVFLILG